MRLISNFFPIEFHNDTFSIRRIKYSKEYLDQLRRQYNHTHSFFRRGDFIYISPMEGSPLDIGEMVNLNDQNDIFVVSSLIKHIFFRVFREKYQNIIPLDFYPFRFLSRKKEDDILFDLLPTNLQGLISYKKLIEVQFRNIQFNNQMKFGAVINIRYQWILNKNCEELLGEGLSLKGLNVLVSEPVPGLEGIIAPDESLIGSIISIEGDNARVETNDGEEIYKLDELYLHKTKRNIWDYLEFKLGGIGTKKIFDSIREKDKSRLNARTYFSEIKKIAMTLSSLDYSNLDGFVFTISERAYSVGKRFSIHPPNFIFDYNPGASNNDQSTGLLNYGPYDSSTFDIKHPNILVVCHKSNRGAFSDFLGKLRDGIPSSVGFKGGMKSKYRLHDISFEIIELDDYSVSGYLKKIADYIKSHVSLPNLVIIETLENFRHKSPENNPYFQAKAYFLSLGVPVQFIKNENIRQPDNLLQWIAESVALQIYAKLGGRPWVLPASSSIDHEIIVGIGSSMLRSNILLGSPQERIVGITTFFTGDGRYLFGNRCREVPFEDYFEELLTNLRQSIKEISEEYGWRENSTIRTTFHIFKPIKNIEIDVVDQLLKEFIKFNIQYCFVTISDHHPYLMFDTSQRGVGKNQKGVFVPDRAQNWIIGEDTCLLQLKGPRDIKTTKHGFSNPVLIKIHEKSTYKDLNTIAQQIYNFTYLSWRGFHPVQKPVTILYSDLIAYQLSNLHKIENWRPEIVNSLLKSKKWFL